MNNGTVVWRCINMSMYSRPVIPVKMRAMIVLVGLLAGLMCGRCSGVENELYSKLSRLEDRVEQLENDLKALPKVAFSVALQESGYEDLGPFATDTVIKYQQIFANIGNSYNPATGIFTAMEKGVYFFTFTVFNYLKTPKSVVALMKNDKQIVSVWDTAVQDKQDSASNAVVLELEEGDNVFVRLMANSIVYDNFRHYTTFNGFLIFAV